jgi:hypothetical protein
MLSRIKEIVTGNEAKESIAQISEEAKAATAAIKEQLALISSLREETESLKVAITEVGAESKNSAEAARQLQEEIKSDISELKTLSTHIQSGIKQKISDDLGVLIKEVKLRLEGAEKLKQEMSAVAGTVNAELFKLKEDTSKLSVVAANIKAADFELGKFSQQLANADREKLQLMAKIDSLEHLVSKMRRQQVR